MRNGSKTVAGKYTEKSFRSTEMSGRRDTRIHIGPIALNVRKAFKRFEVNSENLKWREGEREREKQQHALHWVGDQDCQCFIDQMTNLLIVQFSSTLAIKHKSIPMFQSVVCTAKATIAKLADDSNFYPFFKWRAFSFFLSLSLSQSHKLRCISLRMILCVFVLVCLVPCVLFLSLVVSWLETATFSIVVCYFFRNF